MESWYVYYKLDPRQRDAWLPQVAQLFAQVHAITGVQGRLLQRSDGGREAPGVATLMEVYDGIGDGARFGSALEAAVLAARAAVPACAAVARHTERFAGVPLASAEAGSVAARGAPAVNA
jgi:hypothetical protein